MNEEEFLTKLELEKIPVVEILKGLLQMSASLESGQADSWAELLQEELLKRKNAEGLMNVIEFRANTREEDNELRANAAEALGDLSSDPLWQAFVKHSGMNDSGISLSESIRRLRNLNRLKVGTLCYNDTWGDGTVTALDDFYGKITIDFRDKPGHQMTLSYASTSLTKLDDAHILAVKHRKPAVMDQLVETDPAQVVKMALASYGPLTADQIKEKLIVTIFPEDKWKSFWEKARKGLKGDPLVIMPAKRSEVIKLKADGEKRLDEDRIEALEKENNPDKVVKVISEFLRNQTLKKTDNSIKEIAGSKLIEALKISLKNDEWTLFGKIIVLANDLDLTIEESVLTEEIISSLSLMKIISDLSAREVSSFVKVMSGISREKTLDLLIRDLPELQCAVLKEARGLANSNDEKTRLNEVARAMVLERKCGPEMLCMLAKDLEWTVDALGISVPDIYVFAVEGLSRQSAGSLVKTKNQFLSMLSSPKWMEQALKYCDVDNKKRFLHAIISSGIGGAEDIRSILARAIKVDPSIRTFVETELSGPDKKIKQSEEESGLTSWRSYNRRQEQYRKLVEKDIPANSREMAVARSYGDLRENHEYKAAKEHQTILMRRKQEMEADLKRVRGTDFAGCSTDTAGIGTCVCLENKEGVKATWCLLGEWDYDKELGILSSGSELARKLTGLKVGDKVKLPGADHDQTDEWVVESVSAPTEEIKEWMRGREKG